ncbi:hypothetical protein AVEN_149194-1, partial [Araneus ventricosus]
TFTSPVLSLIWQSCVPISVGLLRDLCIWNIVSAGIRHEADGNEQPRELAGDDGVHAHQLPHHDAHQAQRSALRRDPGAVQHRQGDGVLPALPVHAGQVFGR